MLPFPLFLPHLLPCCPFAVPTPFTPSPWAIVFKIAHLVCVPFTHRIGHFLQRTRRGRWAGVLQVERCGDVILGLGQGPYLVPYLPACSHCIFPNTKEKKEKTGWAGRYSPREECTSAHLTHFLADMPHTPVPYYCLQAHAGARISLLHTGRRRQIVLPAPACACATMPVGLLTYCRKEKGTGKDSETDRQTDETEGQAGNSNRGRPPLK